jgi:hypothetical protein
MNKSPLFIALIFLKFQLSAQTPQNTIPIDTVAKWELKIVQQHLSLDSIQSLQFVAAFKSRLAALDTLQEAGFDMSKRKIVIKSINKSFQARLKSAFSKEQLKRYKDEQQKQRLVFIERMNTKKIKVDEVGEDE